MAKKRSKKFIQKATARMKEKGTLGSFGKATDKKIARAKKRGGKAKKKAVFAENVKHIAEEHKEERDGKRVSKRGAKRSGKRKSTRRRKRSASRRY